MGEELPSSRSRPGSGAGIGSFDDLAALDLSRPATPLRRRPRGAGATLLLTLSVLNDAAQAVGSGTAPGATFLCRPTCSILPEAETRLDDELAPLIGTYAKAETGATPSTDAAGR